MNYCDIFRERIGCNNEEEVFRYLMATLKKTITQWDYFINWSKVLDKSSEFEMDLHSLNFLIGKENVEKSLELLLKKNPSVYKAIPALIACRQKKFDILTSFKEGKLVYESFTFDYPNNHELSNEEIKKIIRFSEGMGLLELFKEKKITNCIDYLIGVEVGLDTNGRKNRGGQMMERIIRFYVQDICEKKGFEFIQSANPTNVKKRWGKKMSLNRTVDFAVFNREKLFLIETNFYSGGGSKLKSTAGEYQSMFDRWKEDGHEFIWITDGAGWKSTESQLRETFNYIDYLLNIEMVAKGLLEKIISD